MKRIFAFLMGAGLLLTACVTHLDPFSGTEGLRVNVNGEKCVMKLVSTSSSQASPSYIYTEDADHVSFSFSTTLVHKTQETTGMVAQYDHYTFSLSLDTAAPLILNKVYDVTGSIAPDFQEGTPTPLKGNIVFVSLTPAIQASFELSSAKNDYELRHGFLRFIKK